MRLPSLLLAATLATSFAAEPIEDFRFKAEILAEGFPKPMQIDIAPDGRIFFNEIDGKVKFYDPKTKKVTEVGSLEVFSEQENGLLGMALDPKFASNGWIYLLHSPKDFEGQVISRFVIKGDKLDMASRKDLLKYGVQRKQCCHHAGALVFGPDGCLYASSGDNTNPFESDGFSPHDERPDRFPWDAQKSSANTNDLRGKIIRIKPKPDGTYEIPKGNLFPVGTPNTRPEIYAMGFRNPWRFSIDAKTGIVYAGDVGPDSNGPKDDRGPSGYDTVNQIRKPGYFGWPYSRGGDVYNDYQFDSKKTGAKFDPLKPINDSPNNTGAKVLPPVQKPLIWYPYGESKEFPMLGGGGRTACAGPVFHYNPKFAQTNGFPEQLNGCLVFFDWNRPFIKWARFDKEFKLAGIEPFTNAVRVGGGRDDDGGPVIIRRPTDMKFGPDGTLYVLDYGETWDVNKNSRILRIVYQRGNLAPRAKAKSNNAQGREPLTVELSAKGSKDPEGATLKYEWRLKPDTKVVSTEESPKLTINTPGNYQAEVTVTDPQGASDTTFLEIMVGNTPPTVTFESPKEGDFFTPGQPIKFKVSVKDAEDGESSAKPDEFGVRTLISATKVESEKKDVHPGLTLMKSSDCFNCHAVNQKLIGPSFVEVANKYRGQPDAPKTAVERILKGSTGVWGQVGMLPHPTKTEDEVHIMVRWIFSLDSNAAYPAMVRAVEGEILAPEDATEGCVIGVTYTDAGHAPALPLSTKASVKLRSRRIEAESAHKDEGGPGGVDASNASNKHALGGIRDGHKVKFPGVSLAGAQSVTIRFASGGEGGKVVLRSGAQDGPVIGEVEVKPTGGWEKWEELSVPLTNPSSETTDIHISFVNPGKSNLMNLDWVQFNEK